MEVKLGYRDVAVMTAAVVVKARIQMIHQMMVCVCCFVALC